VGNCGVRESQHKLIRVAQPCGESVVGWERRAGNRTTSLSGLSHRFWVTDFGDSVVKMESTVQVSSTCEEVGGDARRGSGNRVVACSGNEARREGNRAEGGESRTSSSQGNGR
jgi:hypothetical protein